MWIISSTEGCKKKCSPAFKSLLAKLISIYFLFRVSVKLTQITFFFFFNRKHEVLVSLNTSFFAFWKSVAANKVCSLIFSTPLFFFSGAYVMPSDAFAGDLRSENEFPRIFPQSLTASCCCNLLLDTFRTKSKIASIKGSTSNDSIRRTWQDN